MGDTRIIKKYPNRRLYDTVESRYITLADVRALVTQHMAFVVIDKKTDQDITRSILLQVIAELEHTANPLMSQDFLNQLIRAYGGAMQRLTGDYLEQSLKLFSAQQSQIRDRMRSMVGLDPITAMANLAQENFDRLRQVSAPHSTDPTSPKTRPSPTDSPSSTPEATPRPSDPPAG